MSRMIPKEVGAQPGSQETQSNNHEDILKEKCQIFLTDVLETSSYEILPIKRNVLTLVQDLVDAEIEPEQFCDRLNKLLDASSEPPLIGFLKKSLPLLRQSLMLKEIVIDGIRPPQINAASQPAVVLDKKQ